MFTLSDASKETKQIIKWGLLIIVGLIALFLLFKVMLFIKELIFPTPPPKPTVAFGKLQEQVFPQNVTADTEFTFSIDTVSGNLPTLKGQAKVYRMVQNEPDLLALEKAKDIVNGAGFSGTPRPVSDRIFEWSNDPDLRGIPRTIRFNIVNHNFTINSNYMTDSAILASKNLPNEKEAISQVKDTLSSMTLVPADLDESKTKTTLLAIKNNTLVSSTSLSNSQVIKVDLFQADVDKLPVFYENPDSSNITLLVGGGDSQPQIVGGSYINQQISNTASTYPIKTSDEAFEELKQGKAYITAYSGSDKNIAISNVSLAYYIGSNPQDFLMPIIVFQGNDGFTAYVPAVTDEWISK